MLNVCTFIGNLGADPETRTFSDGGKVTNFRIACTEKWKDRNTGERREKTEWISIAAFGPVADIAAQYLRKGSKCFVSGKFRTRKWQDQSGQDRFTSEIVLQGFDAKLVLLDGPRDSGGQGDSQRGGYDQSPGGYGSGYDDGQRGGYGGGRGPVSSDLDDEIPFACEWRI